MKAYLSLPRYIQGPGEIANLATHTAQFGSQVAIIATDSGWNRLKEVVEAGFSASGSSCVHLTFAGECTHAQVDVLKTQAQDIHADTIVGMGGGKVMDTAKAVADKLQLPLVIVPTCAASDAPCSALSVFYHENGTVDDMAVYPNHPDLVLMDTEVVVNAPVRLNIAGMGDALATWIEARQAMMAHTVNLGGGQATCTGSALAKLCYDILMEHGRAAQQDFVDGKVSDAVEQVVEANTLLSGMGVENCGAAAAHAISNGLGTLDECHGFLHGEKVAFGIIVEMVLDKSPEDELAEVVTFLRDVGLPIMLEDLGIGAVTEEKVRAIAHAACLPGESVHFLPFEVTEDSVYDAILQADFIGCEYKGRC